MEDLLWQIRMMFTGDLEKITLYQREPDEKRSREFTLYINSFNSSVKLKKEWSFLTMMLEVGKILKCSDGNVSTYKSDGCPTCGHGSETEYTLEFWVKA
jgi:hypothetical protein